MKKIIRRDKLKIYGDLLSALYYSEQPTERIVLTHIQLKINAPFDRLKEYIKDLVDLDLIENEPSLKLTEKGVRYLIEYKKILDFMKRMGLSYR